MTGSLNFEQSDLSRAFAIAEWLHKDHYRKSAPGEIDREVLYLTHLTEVLALTVQATTDWEIHAAALLHDAFEDQPETPDGRKTRDFIKEALGQRVHDLIDACTDGEPNQLGVKPLWKVRKEMHLAHMATLAEEDASFLIISLADKLSNAQSIVHDVLTDGDIVWQRFPNAESPENVAWYYNAMREVIVEHIGKAGGDTRVLVGRLNYYVNKVQELAAEATAKGVTMKRPLTNESL